MLEWDETDFLTVLEAEPDDSVSRPFYFRVRPVSRPRVVFVVWCSFAVIIGVMLAMRRRMREHGAAAVQQFGEDILPLERPLCSESLF